MELALAGPVCWRL